MGTLFTGLGAAAALSVTDIIPVHQGGARAVGLTGAQLLTYVGGSYVGKTGAQSMAGPLTIASGTLTASAPALNITQTWNNGAVVFEAINVNVTNLASNYSSILQSWQVSGSTKAAIYSTGRVYGIEFLISTAAVLGLHTLTINGSSTECVSYSYANVADRGAALRHVAFCNPADGSLWSDLIGDSANALALRNGTAQQIFRLYNTYTDSSNYERLTLTGVAGTSVNITAETLGTGADNLNLVLGAAGASGLISFKIDGSQYHLMGAGYFLQSGYHQLAEMTAPAAGATNTVRIYAEDNGAGKTRLMALFATGSAVQLGIEP